MRKRSIFSFVAIFCAFVACVAFAGPAEAFHGNTPVRKAAKFAVISDPHFYDTKLGTTGAAFEAYLAQDRKMVRESEAILDSAIMKILAKKPDFVIISGDLTKDGERSSHEKFARRLALLRAADIKVFVCPGNHDVNNPGAYSYSGDTVTPTPNVSPKEFIKIYRDFGFNEALDHDPASLSYLAEPVKGLWLFSIDSVKYENNATLGHSETSGAIRPETMTWLLKKLADAEKSGKTVIGFMHHGLTEHYTGQSAVFADYVIDHWQTDSQILADAGLKMVFTGHYHANDITSTVRTDNAPKLLDLETGSLVTYPSPIRMASVQNGQVAIHTEYVTKIKYNTGGASFPDYARKYLYDGLLGIAIQTLMHDYRLPQVAAQTYAPYVANAFMAHYVGDEKMTAETLNFVNTLLGSGDPTMIFLGQMLGSLMTDLPPGDTYGLFDLFDFVPVTIPGDIDGDGEVDYRDASMIFFHLKQPAAVLPAADLNGDGTISMPDAYELGKLLTHPFFRW